jgi:hypothetical protein
MEIGILQGVQQFALQLILLEPKVLLAQVDILELNIEAHLLIHVLVQ